MNVFTTTTADLANALSGRAPQNVRVVKSTFSHGSVTRIVSVNGEWFVVYAEATLRALRNGWTPQELELEVAPDNDETPEEFDGDYAHATHWPSLYNSMRNR